MIELKFQSDLNFQLEAINAVVNIFKSQIRVDAECVLLPENGIVPNHFSMSDKQILENLNQIQKLNGIKPVSKLQGRDFSVEMETGTGKTYVYIRTIFELYQKYRFKKFIIVVPSVAIKEGVLKTLNITQKHFNKVYENIPYNYYEYNSRKINLIRQFARSNTIEIMIITIDSFKKDQNIMNQNRDTLHGQRPIDLVGRTNPILFLDEPQNMETDNAKEALSKMQPIFTLRYSATHRHLYNLVYRLTPVDAYKKHLVKKIEVSSVTENNNNYAFLRCLNITANSKGIKAKLELNKKIGSRLQRRQITVKDGNDLVIKTKNPEYDGFIITEINARHNFVKFANQLQIKLGEEHGRTQQQIMKIQIEQTIEEHLRKHEILKDSGIKPLSLFFIDKVDNYRLENGFIRKNFEKAFNKHKKNYADFKHLSAKDVHAGYFSKKKTHNAMKNDKDVFDLIMKNKERLLSPDEPVQFIFSHSALKEGWDNPNVFNICTLNQTISNFKKRQEIGRGMRLPVNRNGDRITDGNHVLTVIANESYKDYVEKLQQEYVDEYGDEFTGIKPDDSQKRKTLVLEKKYRLNPEFKELWKRIAQKTRYAVNIDTDTLIKDCIKEINKITIDGIKIEIEKVTLHLKKDEGVHTKFVGRGTEKLDVDLPIPNILNRITNETNLTRTTVAEILYKIKNLDLLFKNPHEFISSCVVIIKEKLADLLANGIKYHIVEDWYKMELFENIETYSNMIIPANKTIYDGIIFGSEIEKKFVKDLNNMDDVKLFIKLPRWFIVETPIGEYNPDWAVVMDNIDQHGTTKETLYFVTETKGSTDIGNLRPSEQRKIHCAMSHFKSVGTKYKVVENASKLR